eukprot:COSAG02_NODE_6049_length_3845_cov_1.807528_1_plen_125_part_00
MMNLSVAKLCVLECGNTGRRGQPPEPPPPARPPAAVSRPVTVTGIATVSVTATSAPTASVAAASGAALATQEYHESWVCLADADLLSFAKHRAAVSPKDKKDARWERYSKNDLRRLIAECCEQR